jgi:hypothetical protein
MRILSSGQRTRTAPRAPLDVVPARAHVEVAEREIEPPAPRIIYRDIPGDIAALSARTGSLTDAALEQLSPLPESEVEGLSFVRELFAYTAPERVSLEASDTAEIEASAVEAEPDESEDVPVSKAVEPGELLTALGAGPRSAREIGDVVGVSAAVALRILRALEADGKVRAFPSPGRVKRWERTV